MDFTVSEEERAILLAEARESIAARLENRKARGGTDSHRDAHPVFAQPCGAFVTLHKGGNLRGCIGSMSARMPLAQTVRVMACAAAFDDPRFSPLESGELEQCRIEISALSPLEICRDPRAIILGVHGLYLSRGGRSGVLLPQVPLEQGWNLDEYLDYICIKAALPPHSYEAADGELYTFTAIVFGEK